MSVKLCNWSRKYLPIELVLLENWLLRNASKYEIKPIAYLMLDLEACYDRQILWIGGLVGEFLGLNHHGIKVITKIWNF